MTATDTTALASLAWAMIVRDTNPMPPLIARDFVMDGVGCERGEAVKLLAGAAADWLESERRRWLVWTRDATDGTVTGDMCLKFRSLDLDETEQLSHYMCLPDELLDRTEYDDFCDRVNNAVAILRELLA